MADYIEAKKSRLKYYQKIPLYYQTKGRKLVLYKPGGKTIEEVRLEKERVLGKLYIKQEEKIRGYDILSKCKFGYKEIALTALQHHEKLDGSGYPHGITSIKETAQIIGFIDCYEALTNDDRPYRNAMSPFKTLTLIKQDVESDKFSRKLFEKFAYSLL